MTPTSSDVASLSKALTCWEVAEYTFATLVAIACAGEYVADFTNWFTGGIKEAKEKLAKGATLLLIAALAFELVCLVKTNSLSGQLIGSLSEKAENADKKAQSAIEKSAASETKAAGASRKANEAFGNAEAAKEAAGFAKASADEAREKLTVVIEEVKLLSPRTLSPVQQNKIAEALKKSSRFPYPTRIESYGMDGEGTALATQLLSTLASTGYGTPGDGRADQVVSGGFEWGISIRGPGYEMPYMTALRDALVNIGKLQQVSINGPSPQAGAMMGGAAAIGGAASMSGGGGQPIQRPIPTGGPVSVLVGIRPPILLPASGKKK
jgi:hypothetical protein